MPVMDQRGVVVFVVALREAKTRKGVVSQGHSAMATGTLGYVVNSDSDGADSVVTDHAHAGLLLGRRRIVRTRSGAAGGATPETQSIENGPFKERVQSYTWQARLQQTRTRKMQTAINAAMIRSMLTQLSGQVWSKKLLFETHRLRIHTKALFTSSAVARSPVYVMLNGCILVQLTRANVLHFCCLRFGSDSRLGEM